METDPRSQRAERLQQLTKTGPDSAMGRLLRKFWHPVALSDKLAPSTAMPLRILAEDLTLYRGESGVTHLVGGVCAHRSSLLHTGWVEGERIRCMYHGWQYDGTGQCTQRPAERDNGLPNLRVAGYPTKEYGGLIFAYFGAGEPPSFDVIRKPEFEASNSITQTHRELWNTNWFQMVENSLDGVHVSFVHARGRAGAFINAVTQAIPELDYLETEAGLRQISNRGAGNIRISDWTFPNFNHISTPGPFPGDPWIDIGHWNVPVDDEHTLRFNIFAIVRQGGERDERIADYLRTSSEYDPAQHHDALFHNEYPDDQAISLANAQDYLAQRGQGVIVDRSLELLGRSDAGIVLLRRVFVRELDLLIEGKPTKAWRKLDQAVPLPPQRPTTASV